MKTYSNVCLVATDGNSISGSIPTQITKLKKIRMINIGRLISFRFSIKKYRHDSIFDYLIKTPFHRSYTYSIITANNKIRGSIPSLSIKEDALPTSNADNGCQSFPNPLQKMGFYLLRKSEPSESSLIDLESFSLCKLSKLVRL